MGIELFFSSVRNRQRVKGAGFYAALASFPVANGSQGFALDESTAILYCDISGVWTSVSGVAGSYVLNRQNVEGAGFYTNTTFFPVANGSRGFALDQSTEILYADIASVWTALNEAYTIQNRVSTFQYFNDFFAVISATSNTANDLFFSGTGTGTASASLGILAANQIGLISVSCGTTATGRAALQTSLSSFAFGQGATIYEALMSPAPLNLSDGTNRYSIIAGFFDTLAATQLDCCAFVYDTGGVTTGSTAALYWQTYTASSPSNTFNAGGFVQVTVNVGQFYKLRIEINALGTQALFYVDGVLIATHTTNIPTTFNRSFGFGAQITKNLALLSRPFYIDYLLVQQTLTTSR